jgi:hypothetical protein
VKRTIEEGPGSFRAILQTYAVLTPQQALCFFAAISGLLNCRFDGAGALAVFLARSGLRTLGRPQSEPGLGCAPALFS